MIENQIYEKALYIFKELLNARGMIKNTKETKQLFSDYADAQIHSELMNIASIMDVDIFKGVGVIYMYPKYSSQFSYKNADVRAELSSKSRNNQVYLSYIILLCFMDMIYGGESEMKKKQDFVIKDNLIKKVKEFLPSQDNYEMDIDEKYNYNYSAACKLWNQLIDENLDKDKAEGINTKSGIIDFAMRLFLNSNLIEIEKDIQVKYSPTIKLDDYIRQGALNIERFNEVLSIAKEINDGKDK